MAKISRSVNLVDQLYQREFAFPAYNQCQNVWKRSYIDKTLEHSTSFYYKNLFGHFGCVNSAEFSPDGNLMVSSGDDKRVLLWNLMDAIHGMTNCYLSLISYSYNSKSNMQTINMNHLP